LEANGHGTFKIVVTALLSSNMRELLIISNELSCEYKLYVPPPS